MNVSGRGPTVAMARRLALASLACAMLGIRSRASHALEPQRRWYDAALAMRELASSWGDQAYGAVLVADGAIIGEGPSRVVQRGDPNAHAEREAIADALRRVGPSRVAGSVLYSTSRPCRECERAAARAGVARMIHGPALTDAGAPSP